MREASKLRVVQTGGALSITSTSAVDSGGGTEITVSVVNTGSRSYGNFSQVDVLTEYTNSTGDREVKRMTYVCKQLCGGTGDPGDVQWTVTSIAPDGYNPKMWDPDETSTIKLRAVPPVKVGTSGTVAVVVAGGVSDSAYFSN